MVLDPQSSRSAGAGALDGGTHLNVRTSVSYGSRKYGHFALGPGAGALDGVRAGGIAASAESGDDAVADVNPSGHHGSGANVL
jgi:hypothetical protein